MDENFLSQATLLYVEDDEDIRTVLERRLKSKVQTLHVAHNGEEGLEKYKTYKPDVILTDVTMPKMNGIEMSRIIKDLDENIPIIIISAHNDARFLLDAIELGINGYLLKPIDKVKLFHTLEEKIKPIFLEKQIEEQRKKILLQSRFALLGEMISMIAHQWRQPLNMIALTMSSLKLKFSLDKYEIETKEGRKSLPYKVEQDLKNVENKVQYLSSVIDDFANFYKPMDEVSTIHIKSTIKEAVESFKHSIHVDDLEIIEQYNSDKHIKVYKDIFMQICINLLTNANENILLNDIKSPQINVISNDVGNDVEVTIEDNAGGISEDIIDKIFDPYFSTKVGKNGNGLGLYMSKLIIQEHLDGEISVENTNNGARFTIKLKEVS